MRWLKALLGLSRSQPCADAQERSLHAARLLEALARRKEALRQADAAQSRRDDRDYGRALMEARQATADVLRLERSA